MLLLSKQCLHFTKYQPSVLFDNDIVIIAPWDFKESEQGDIVWRFTLPQVEWLKANSHIPKDF